MRGALVLGSGLGHRLKTMTNLHTPQNSTLAVPQREGANVIAVPWRALQFIGWGLYCVISFLSLTLWYGPPKWMHIVDIVIQAFIGAGMTWPLSKLLHFSNQGTWLRRISLHLFVVGIIALIWTLIRMKVFEVLIDAPTIWEDFGGWYFTSVLIFSFWSACYYFMRAATSVVTAQQNANDERVRRLTAESLSREAQLKMLRYQINPHFIFNTMNSIKSLVATNRSDEAQRMIGRFSDFLRITLDKDPPLFVPLSEELNTVSQYLAVEEMRFGNRLSLEVDVRSKLLTEQVPSLILQPIVENAVRHGVEKQNAPVEIGIKVKREEDRMIIVVSDTGPGIKFGNAPAGSGSGLGLHNVQKRLESVYGEAFSFSTEANTPTGVLVTLNIPLGAVSVSGTD